MRMANDRHEEFRRAINCTEERKGFFISRIRLGARPVFTPTSLLPETLWRHTLG